MAKTRKKVRDFPGARAMGLSFRTAVEQYLLCNYGERVQNKTLELADLRNKPVLYEAVKTYKYRFGSAPFGIVSVRQLAGQRFNETIELLASGRLNLGPKMRATAKKALRRARAKK